MSCDDGQEEHLEELLIQINQKFNHLKNDLGNLGENKLLLITAVKIMDEYYETKKKVEEKRQELKDLSKNHELMITIEEGSSGGFGAHVLMHLAEQGILDDGFKIRNLYLPDTFIQQGDASDMYAQAGLNSENIVKTALKVFGISKSEFKVIKS